MNKLFSFKYRLLLHRFWMGKNDWLILFRRLLRYICKGFNFFFFSENLRLGRWVGVGVRIHPLRALPWQHAFLCLPWSSVFDPGDTTFGSQLPTLTPTPAVLGLYQYGCTGLQLSTELQRTSCSKTKFLWNEIYFWKVVKRWISRCKMYDLPD